MILCTGISCAFKVNMQMLHLSSGEIEISYAIILYYIIQYVGFGFQHLRRKYKVTRSACIIYIYILYWMYKNTYTRTPFVCESNSIKCISICLLQHCSSVCRRLGNNIYNRDCVLGVFFFFVGISYIYYYWLLFYFFELRTSEELLYSVISL